MAKVLILLNSSKMILNKVSKKIVMGIFIMMQVCLLMSEQDYCQFVDPFIGTDGHGHTFPGATLPFGMVQLSPDTRKNNWDACSGYHYSDQTIIGFSHTHLSGTGVGDYGDIRLMPTVGRLQFNPGDEKNSGPGYCSRFSHFREKASPGYYQVYLDSHDINVELTTTFRAGLHRYTFPSSSQGNVIIDLVNGIANEKIIELQLEFINNSEIKGLRHTQGWAKNHRVFFHLHFSRPAQSQGIVINDNITYNRKKARGKNIKGFVTFSTQPNEPILVKVGISAVSAENARENMEKELPDWDFDRIKRYAATTWNKALSKIQVEGGNIKHKRIFYTALYHTMIVPNLYSDVDGSYCGMDGLVHQAPDFNYYTVFSLWDTFRALHPLLTIIEPRRTNDFILTLLTMHKEGGRLPIWELAANDTLCMIGYHAVSVITDAYIKGINRFDVNEAFQAMKNSSNQNDFGLSYYRRQGYIAADQESDSVSKTLEYAYDDWCIAQMARALNRQSDYEIFHRRALNYINLFDSQIGFMRPRRNGNWLNPFDPREVNFNYTEANAWQYTFFAPHDIYGLIELYGSKEAFYNKLEELFNTTLPVTGRQQADITGLIGQYAHGNEPSHHLAYLYQFTPQPWKTQDRVRQIMESLYSDKPDGLCGNEDCGQMSAWYVFSAMGFYPVCPGQDTYLFGCPIFNKIIVDGDRQTPFVIECQDMNDNNRYIKQAFLNSQPYEKRYLKHDDIVSGGVLSFQFGPQANSNWAASDDALPPDHSDRKSTPAMPTIASSPNSKTFIGSTEITLASADPQATIRYTLDGQEPTTNSPVFSTPFTITRSTFINAVAQKENHLSLPVTAQFIKIDTDWKMTFINPPNRQYPGEGDHTLFDTIRGNTDFRTGAWLGFYGQDFDLDIDLKKPARIQSVCVGFLQNSRSWIFFPQKITLLGGGKEKEFRTLAVVQNKIPPQDEKIQITDFCLKFKSQNIRFLKIVGHGLQKCPAWHVGTGNPCWLFVDEIVIK